MVRNLFRKLRTDQLNTDRDRTIACLEAFVQNFHFGELLTAEKSKEALEQSVVGIVSLGTCGISTSNGLLISENGYCITANHCIEDNEISGIKLHTGSTYPIIKKLCLSRKDDVALVKADLPGDYISKVYRFMNSEEIKENDIIAIMKREKGHLDKKYGQVIECFPYAYNKSLMTEDGKSINIGHHFLSRSFSAGPGDSGAAVVNVEGRLMGLLSAGNNEINVFCSVKLDSVLNLISHYINHLKEKQND